MKHAYGSQMYPGPDLRHRLSGGGEPPPPPYDDGDDADPDAPAPLGDPPAPIPIPPSGEPPPMHVMHRSVLGHVGHKRNISTPGIAC